MRKLFFFILLFFASMTAAKAADLYTFTDEEGVVFYTNVSGDNRQKIPFPIKRTLPKETSPAAVDRKAYEGIIRSASQGSNLDPDLIRAIIQAESNFNPNALSPKGAMGLMQLMPATAREMAVANPFDPEENIHSGSRYLDGLLGTLNRNLPLSLAAYNAGPTRVINQKRIPEETQDYVKRVMRYYIDLKKGTKKGIF